MKTGTSTTTEPGGKATPRRLVFTDWWLQKLKHPDTGQEVFTDNKQVGLTLLVSGRTKTFRTTVAMAGKYVTSKIGRYPEMTLSEARKMTLDYRAQANKGIDPRKPKASPLTYGEAVDQFVELHCKVSQRTWRQTAGHLRNASPAWLAKPIASISKADAYKVLDGFVAEGKGYKAQVTLAWLRKLWRWSFKRDLVPTPVMDAVEISFEKRVRDRTYSDVELKSIWKAADQLDPVTGGFFKLLVLLAPRKSALAGMRWSDLRDDGSLWVTPFALVKSRKTATPRTYQTPLPALAMRILKSLPRTTERVFPTVPEEPAQLLARQLTQAGGPENFGYHVCRHTIATHLQNAGHSSFEIGLVLNHAGSSGATSHYVHGFERSLKLSLLEEWARHVESLVTPAGAVLLI